MYEFDCMFYTGVHSCWTEPLSTRHHLLLPGRRHHRLQLPLQRVPPAGSDPRPTGQRHLLLEAGAECRGLEVSADSQDSDHLLVQFLRGQFQWVWGHRDLLRGGGGATTPTSVPALLLQGGGEGARAVQDGVPMSCDRIGRMEYVM